MEPENRQLRFYVDSHIAKAIVIQLKRRGVDIIHCDDVGMSEASDAEHLVYATEHQRVMVSQDRDYVDLHYEAQRLETSHEGIIVIRGQLQGEAQISFLVKSLFELDELVQGGAATLEGDFINKLTWL